jgi:hypothetical protein
MTLDPFLVAVTQQMQPEGRAQHQATMLEELRPSLPDDVTLADLVAGWQILAHPHGEQEPASVTHRRGICAELATIATPWATRPGQLVRAVSAWQAWLEACQQSADPRLVVMGKTFARELVELQSA